MFIVNSPESAAILISFRWSLYTVSNRMSDIKLCKLYLGAFCINRFLNGFCYLSVLPMTSFHRHEWLLISVLCAYVCCRFRDIARYSVASPGHFLVTPDHLAEWENFSSCHTVDFHLRRPSLFGLFRYSPHHPRDSKIMWKGYVGAL